MPQPRVRTFGEAALLVELDTVASVANARRARLVATSIDRLRAATPALGVPVPAAASVLVPFDPEAADADEVASLVGRAVAAVPDAPPDAGSPARHEIHVDYGGDAGPDLDAVASELGLRAADVVELHATAEYEVLFLGFAPGFAYLGEVHARLVVPRLATPRVRIPAGSVAIAGSMTAVYPQVSPGGWRILGRTDERLFDATASPPARLRPGDRVRFVPAR